MQLLYVGGFPLGLHGVANKSFSYTITLLIKAAWDVKEDLPKYIYFQALSSSLLPRQYLSGYYQKIKNMTAPSTCLCTCNRFKSNGGKVAVFARKSASV